MKTSEVDGLPPEAFEALAKGRKIDAVRIVREQTGLGFKEANDRVKAHLRAHPGAAPAAIGPQGGSVFKWLVILGVLAFAVYRFLG